MAQVLGIYILRRGTQLVVKISAIGFSKENCFARRFELCSSVMSLISGNRPFHARGAATAIARSPKAFVADRSCTAQVSVLRQI